MFGSFEETKILEFTFTAPAVDVSETVPPVPPKATPTALRPVVAWIGAFAVIVPVVVIANCRPSRRALFDLGTPLAPLKFAEVMFAASKVIVFAKIESLPPSFPSPRDRKLSPLKLIPPGETIDETVKGMKEVRRGLRNKRPDAATRAQYPRRRHVQQRDLICRNVAAGCRGRRAKSSAHVDRRPGCGGIRSP